MFLVLGGRDYSPPEMEPYVHAYRGPGMHNVDGSSCKDRSKGHSIVSV